jgi:hypothetical protein
MISMAVHEAHASKAESKTDTVRELFKGNAQFKVSGLCCRNLASLRANR